MDDPEYRAGQSHVQLALDDLDITRYPRHVSRESSKSVDHSCHKIEDHGNSTSESFDDSVKSPTRKHIAKVIILHLTVVPALICIMVIPYFTSRVASTLRAHPPASCSPDDIFRYKEPYDPWATSGTFKITLGFGSMSFSNVKLIDVIWVVVVGRGGQGILGGIAYSVFTRSLVQFMEQRPVSYGTYEAITFANSTFRSLWLMMKEYTTNGGLQAKLAIMWMIVASSYVLAFPTLMSAVTGYASNSEGFLRDRHLNLLPWSSLLPVVYTIHDGWRLGLNGNQFVTAIQSYPGMSAEKFESSPFLCQNYITHLLAQHRVGILSDNIPRECLMLWYTTLYVESYGGGPYNITSTFNNSGIIIRLDAPTLEITSHRPDSNNTLYTNNPYSNSTFDVDYLEDNGTCLTLNTYRWGFSFLLLFISILLTVVWAIGMYIMWLDA